VVTKSLFTVDFPWSCLRERINPLSY